MAATGEGKKEAVGYTIGCRIPPNSPRSRGNVVYKVDRDVAHIAITIHYVSRVCSKYFICFRHMLQVFHQDVAKVDLDVANTCMLQAHVSSVSVVLYVGYKYFI